MSTAIISITYSRGVVNMTFAYTISMIDTIAPLPPLWVYLFLVVLHHLPASTYLDQGSLDQGSLDQGSLDQGIHVGVPLLRDPPDTGTTPPLYPTTGWY